MNNQPKVYIVTVLSGQWHSVTYMLAFRAFVWPPNPVRERESHRRNSKVTCTAQNLVVDIFKALLQHIEEQLRSKLQKL